MRYPLTNSTITLRMVRARTNTRHVIPLRSPRACTQAARDTSDSPPPSFI